MGTTLDRSTVHVHDVRDVAPQKRMLCVSFPLPKDVAFTADGEGENVQEPPSKRARTDTD